MDETDRPDLRIGVITDIHHGPRAHFFGKLRKLGDRALDLCDAVVEAMNARIKPDLVVHLGDAVEDVSADRDPILYHQVMEALGELDAPILHLTGNHDHLHMNDARLDELRGPNALCAPLERGGIELLALPTHSDFTRCWVEEDDIEVLRVQLAAGRQPALLFAHHPLDDQDLTGNPWFDGLERLALVENRVEARRIIEESGRVLAVVNGHVHWNYRSVHGGVPYFTIQSLIENIAPDGSEPMAAEAFAVIDVAGDRLRVAVYGNDAVVWDV